MNSTITDLWYGNICELEACGSSPHILRKEAHLAAKTEEFRANLSADQKKLFEQLLETMYENNSDYAEAAFAHGFCLGMRLAGEAWMPPMI